MTLLYDVRNNFTSPIYGYILRRRFDNKEDYGRLAIIHVFNKMNDATISTEMTVPRKEMVLNFMS